MTTTVDQKAYLQKYLSGPSKDKKKKKKKDKKAIKGKGFKIIDDDLDLSKLRALDRDELDIYGEGEDAPQVAGIIDERPEELRRMEQFATKWKVINQDDGFNSNIKIEEIKQSVKEVEKENEVIFGKMYSDSEDERERDAKKQENDASPPRKNTSKKLTESPQRKKAPNYDSDPSPPRKSDSRKQSDDQKMNSAKKRSDSDASPPRKNSRKQVYSSPSRMSSLKRQNDDSDASPPRKNSSKKHNNDSDASPPRKKASKKNYDSDLSPPRKHSRKDDASPPRKKASKNYGNDASSSRKRESRKETKDSKRANRQSRWGDFEFEKNEIEMISQEYEKSNRKKSPKRQSDSDISPPRKKDRNTDNKDKKKGNDKKDRTQSRSQKKDSDSDLSPPRKNKKNERYNQSDSDLSPPRKKDMNQKKRSNNSPPPTNKKMPKTLEGKMAGLQDAKQLRQENESFRRREDEVFNKMGDDVSGRNAKAVSRKSKRETSEDRTKQKEKAERQKEIDEKYKKWSRGLKQIEDHQERVAEFMHEASKPLARHQGDSDLEGRLKGVERDGDPMLQYIRERKREKGLLAPEKPSYKGSFPPNRFNIRPGYRWDGVDRSNGYEKKYFDQQSKRKAQEEEAYKWSTEDL